jgi:hypothetical protein
MVVIADRLVIIAKASTKNRPAKTLKWSNLEREFVFLVFVICFSLNIKSNL